MDFLKFKKQMQDHVSKMLSNTETLFTVDLDKDSIIHLYLNSFPEGTNPVYRERREYDCSCCKHFVRNFGNVVTIKDKKIISIWDFVAGDENFQIVINTLSHKVHSAKIQDVFITKEKGFGTEYNFEINQEDGKVQRWEHFRIDLPAKFQYRGGKSEASVTGEFRDIRNVFKRSLEEITIESIEVVLDLTSQKSLYKGEEWIPVLNKFMTLKKEFMKINKQIDEDLFTWEQSIKVGAVVGKIRNHSIGTLLINISEGMDLDEAVRKYEAIVAPTNYKRPKAIFTKKMVEQAQKTITDLGYLNSLSRRYATIEDITVNNILFANRDSVKKMQNDPFMDLTKDIVQSSKKFDKVEEVTIEDFVSKILPNVTDMEVLLENKHSSNMMSLIAPKIKDSKTMFKWNNNFSWAYNGNITDSMKERVKAAGGRVDGDLRFTIQWNEDGDNPNDYDAHCTEPNNNEIYYGNRGYRYRHPSSGMLDVDIITPGSKVAVENIIYTNKSKMKEGTYIFTLHNFSHRGGRSGFSAEIEFDGQIFSFEYRKDIPHKGNIEVALVQYSKKEGFKIIRSLDSSVSSKDIWGVQSNQFVPVSVVMFSPNYWDEQKGIGHKHYFFMLNGCKNETSPNAFFNEFLKEDLLQHKRVFEALGGRMKVEDSDNQLSGVGFSSTQRNSVICKVQGSFTRTIKIVF